MTRSKWINKNYANNNWRRQWNEPIANQSRQPEKKLWDAWLNSDWMRVWYQLFWTNGRHQGHRRITFDRTLLKTVQGDFIGKLFHTKSTSHRELLFNISVSLLILTRHFLLETRKESLRFPERKIKANNKITLPKFGHLKMFASTSVHTRSRN